MSPPRERNRNRRPGGRPNPDLKFPAPRVGLVYAPLDTGDVKGRDADMIRYTLNCDKGHGFESWFQSAVAFERLAETGMLTCSVCGSDGSKSALMAPRCTRPRSERRSGLHAKRTGACPHARHAHDPLETALRALRREVEANTEYVGSDFTARARANP